MGHEINANELLKKIQDFHDKTTVNQRYASYDFCYGYFQTHRHHLAENMELSCLHLWGYLASWGMLRGSSQLLKECNMKVLSDVIVFLDEQSEEIWNLDVEKYEDESIGKLSNTVYAEICNKIKEIKIADDTKKGINPTITLVTKIMLGTLGCTPAFDNYFTKTFKIEFSKNDEYRCVFNGFDSTSLRCIYQFYVENQGTLRKINYPVIGFNGKPIMDLRYKNAKLIDMYGFAVGKELSKKEATNKDYPLK